MLFHETGPIRRPKSPELMLQEMDTAGVTMGAVQPQRLLQGSISNDDIIGLLGDFPGRFVLWYGRAQRLQKGRIAGRNPPYRAERPPQGHLRMEPGALDKPMYADDPRIYPSMIYANGTVSSRSS